MKERTFIPIFEVTEPNVEGKTPSEFMPVMETKSKKRKMEWPMDMDTTVEAIQFLMQGGQPANFKIMMTNKCNLSCTYCFQQHNKEMILWTDESLDFFFKALMKSDTSNCWNQTKTWDWFGGEPLIYKQKILEFMRRNKNAINATTDVEFAITTNATLLTDDFIEEYLSYNGTFFIVSLDTVFLDVDNRNHTDKSMKQVLEALNGIARHAGPYNTSITLTVSPEQTLSIENSFEVLYRVGVRNFLVNPLIYNKYTMADWTQPGKTLQDLRDVTLAFADKYKDVVMEYGAEVATKNTTNCLTGGKIFGIDGSGDVTGCFFFSNDKEKHSDIVLANVFSGLTNPNYDGLAKMDTQFYEEDEQCRTCDLWDLCYVCPAGVFDTSGGTRYFQSNGACQDSIRCHVAVKEQMEAVNIPFRQQKIQEFQNG
jgi:radical SAM protein with 4Fe4S-binding SPASM domain